MLKEIRIMAFISLKTLKIITLAKRNRNILIPPAFCTAYSNPQYWYECTEANKRLGNSRGCFWYGHSSNPDNLKWRST